MKQLTILLFSLLLISFSGREESYSEEVENRIKHVEENALFSAFEIEGKPNITLQERMDYYGIKGLSIAVINNYQIDWAKSYGWADSAEQRVVTTETLFQAGSLSKSLNAAGVIKLVLDKKLDLLNTDINNYLTSWKFPYDSVSKNKKISVGNLISHTAGLTRGGSDYSKTDSLPSLVQILDGKRPAKTTAIHSESVPGTAYKYSNGGVTISQLLIQDITHLPYDKYMQENVFQPLSMTNSFYFPSSAQKQATGYYANGTEVEGKYGIIPELAAGGLWSTPTDISKFIIEMQLCLKGKTGKVLTPQMTNLMLTPYLDKIDKEAGLGVFIVKKNSENYFTHDGGCSGFSCRYYASFENGNGVVVMANTDNSGLFLDEIINSIAVVYKWKDFYSPPAKTKKKIIAVPDNILEQYTGAYKQNNEIVTITKKGNSLWYQASGIPWKMYFTSNTEFFSYESKSEKYFYQDKDNKTLGFIKKMAGKELGKVEKIESIALPDDLFGNYTGTYTCMGEIFTITKKDKILYLRMDSPWLNDKNKNAELHFISKTQFYLTEEFGVLYKFFSDKKGVVSGYGEKGPTIKKMKPVK